MKSTLRVIMLVIAVIMSVYSWKLLNKTPGSENNTEQHEITSSNDPFNRTPDKLIISKHAACRMDCRKIDEREIREILQKGTINWSKSEPQNKPDPKYALEGTTSDNQKVRIVFADSPKGLVVVTVIDLVTDWECACN
ncbi:DUF4258 domain-containing protein [Gynurincola endophyticus]|jgi:hypothetical protein|uniref:DUF4258 domain-containing protein n=1 Tax=Gynurincola endophyticus TaxID=2479004 RepID=UPI000F8F0322|nr:DUF4258 domain-containing protein [Gynurincola endophyticus]